MGDFNSKVIEIFSNQLKGINKETYQVITSCKGEQMCWQYCTNRTYFTEALYRGCLSLKADSDKDGVINLTELHKYIVRWVNEHCTKDQDTQMYPDGSIFPIVEY